MDRGQGAAELEKAFGFGLDADAVRERLSSAGVDVEYRCEPGLVHNFMMLDDVSPACAAAADRVAADVRARLVAG